MGIEPTTTAWQAVVLPLNYTRTMMENLNTNSHASASAG